MMLIRNVFACALLLVAGTVGSATAGALIGSAGIKDNTVTGADVRNGSVTGAEVRDGSLELGDLSGLEQGVKGLPGPPGPPGADGVPGLQYRSTAIVLAPNQQVSLTAECTPSEKAIAGGVSSTAPGLVTTRRSFPDRDHWTVEVVKDGSATQVTVFAWAVCIPD